MSNRILFRYNADGAQRHINNVIEKYVTHVSAVSSEIANFGIGVPTRILIYDAIYNGGKKVRELLLAKAKMPDDETLANVVIKGVSDKMEHLEIFTSRINASNETIYNGISVRNPSLFEYVSIDDNGIVTLDENHAEKIREECREYISTKTGIKLANLQKTIVESMQEIYDEIYNQVVDDEQSVSPDSKMLMYYPHYIWEINKDPRGCMVFKPRAINFDPM